jgi:NADH-quinone oxidoreductase chain I
MARPHPALEILYGGRTLFSGLNVTISNFFRPRVTELYPHEKPRLSPAFRSAIELVRFEETGTHDCVACNQCVKICPSACITLDGEKPEGLKRKRATLFEMDFALCSLCGLCVQVCPTDTLGFSQRYDDSAYTRQELLHDLLRDFRDSEGAYLEQAREEATKNAEEAAAKKAAAASVAATAGGEREEKKREIFGAVASSASGKG